MEPRGLTSQEARERLRVEGPNALPDREVRGTLAIARGVLVEPMFLLLLAASGVYFLLGDLREALVLLGSIGGVIALTIVQERRSERALAALRELASPRALVLRDGEQQRIGGREVVRGDVLVLGEGDLVAADARLVAATDLELDEALLTGESLPVARRAGETVHSGTLVVRGHARAEVTATGLSTEIGRIGVSLATLQRERTSLEKETARIVRIVATVAVVLAVATALIHSFARDDWLAGALAGLTLAMAIVPEEFPVVLTLFLALGAWRIARQGVLTRRMSAIEALGTASVLCVDKTGTLTENRMQVVESERAAVDVAALASELDAFDPMERAIVAAASPAALAVRRTHVLERDYPFGDAFLAMCHVWRDERGRRRVVVKGAPETVFALCGMEGGDGAVEAATSRGRRVLATAETDWSAEPLADPARYPFRFSGLVALADPLRPSVPAAVADCRAAGIRVVMITGDYPGTARHVALEAGLDGGRVTTGDEIARASDVELAERVGTCNVFARVRPAEKLRLVQAFRALGHVVAMTGDGVNDAPALRAAGIGIAMGSRGTDVAREAADLVLLEDDFAAIVATVRLGRRIYANVQHAMRYLVAVHVPIAGMSFLPVVMGGPSALTPMHVVFLEFLIDPACTLVFEAEPVEAEAMRRPPRDPRAALFSRAMLWQSLVLGGASLLAVALVHFAMLRAGRSEPEVRALSFTTLFVGNVGLILAVRAGSSSLAAVLKRRNRAWAWISAAALGALALALTVPALASIFGFAPPRASDLAIALSAALFVPAASFLVRALRSRARGD